MIKDLVIRESYEKAGKENVSWNKIGILIESNGKQYVRLYHIPGQLVCVFEQKPKETQAQPESEGLGAMDNMGNQPPF